MSLVSGPISGHECLGVFCICQLSNDYFDPFIPDAANIYPDSKHVTEHDASAVTEHDASAVTEHDISSSSSSSLSFSEEEIEEEGEIDIVTLSSPVTDLLSFYAFKEGHKETSMPQSRHEWKPLSLEERQEIRREKNRRSAQISRERKSAELALLQQRVLELESANTKLVSENTYLRAEVQELKVENDQLTRALIPYLENKKPRLM